MYVINIHLFEIKWSHSIFGKKLSIKTKWYSAFLIVLHTCCSIPSYILSSKTGCWNRNNWILIVVIIITEDSTILVRSWSAEIDITSGPWDCIYQSFQHFVPYHLAILTSLPKIFSWHLNSGGRELYRVRGIQPYNMTGPSTVSQLYIFFF